MSKIRGRKGAKSENIGGRPKTISLGKREKGYTPESFVRGTNGTVSTTPAHYTTHYMHTDSVQNTCMGNGTTQPDGI